MMRNGPNCRGTPPFVGNAIRCWTQCGSRAMVAVCRSRFTSRELAARLPEQPGIPRFFAIVTWSSDQMPSHVRFLVDAASSPGLLPRLLQPFAKRDLVPDRMWSHRSGETMHIEIAVETMPDNEIHLVEGNLRQIVGVHQVIQVRPEMHRAAA